MEDRNCGNQVFTVPNVLSAIRLCLIPVFVLQYAVMANYAFAALTVIISALTDVVDGVIARRFNLITHLGRILDPVADKLTQIAVMICLCFRYKYMIIPLAILTVKELANGIVALMMLKKTKNTINSAWHGKLATVLLYCMAIIHLFWIDIPTAVSIAFIAACVAAMGLSFVLYTVDNLKAINAVSDNRLVN